MSYALKKPYLPWNCDQKTSDAREPFLTSLTKSSIYTKLFHVSCIYRYLQKAYTIRHLIKVYNSKWIDWNLYNLAQIVCSDLNGAPCTRRKLSYSKYVVVWGLFGIWENLCLIPGFVQKHIQYIGINNNYLHILLCPPTSITKQIIEIDLRQLNIKDSLWCASNISKPHESRVVSGSKLLWKQFALPRLSVILFPRESLKETLFVTLLLLAKSKWTNEWWKKFRILAGLIFYVQKQLLQKHEFHKEFFLEEKVFSWVKSD